MIVTRVNNRTIHLNSILLILILFVGTLVFQKTNNHKLDCNSHSTQTEITLIKNNAPASTGIQNYQFQKTWIPNKDNFKILSFDKSQFLDSEEVDQRILITKKIREKYIRLSISINLHQFFTHESDEIPILS